MLLLADGLASGALIAQYEQLYRKNPELTSLESKKPENQNKNRYRDISPCKYKKEKKNLRYIMSQKCWNIYKLEILQRENSTNIFLCKNL